MGYGLLYSLRMLSYLRPCTFSTWMYEHLVIRHCSLIILYKCMFTSCGDMSMLQLDYGLGWFIWIVCERRMFKPRGEAEWFKHPPQVYNQIKHDKAIVESKWLVLCILTLVSMDTTGLWYNMAVIPRPKYTSRQMMVFFWLGIIWMVLTTHLHNIMYYAKACELVFGS